MGYFTQAEGRERSINTFDLDNLPNRRRLDLSRSPQREVDLDV